MSRPWGKGTLGETYDVIAKSDLVMLLIADSAQAKMYPRILAAGAYTHPLCSST